METKKEIVIDGVTYVPKGSEVSKRAMPLKGKEYCIVRTYSAGVFAGWVNRKIKGKEMTIFGARRLWKWVGALDCIELAKQGPSKPNDCKFSVVHEEVDLKEVIEIDPCSVESKKIIESVKACEM